MSVLIGVCLGLGTNLALSFLRSHLTQLRLIGCFGTNPLPSAILSSIHHRSLFPVFQALPSGEKTSLRPSFPERIFSIQSSRT